MTPDPETPWNLVRLLCGMLLCAACAIAPAADASAEIEGPAWFKNSFLDLRDDLKEAAAANKRLMVYFGQNGCPYCKRLMNVNFSQKDIVDKTRKNFDAIEINIFGSREVTWTDGRTRSEKEFAALLKVQFTPTLLFLDAKGDIALRVNGYYPPHRFMAALDYASQRNENKVSFAEFQKSYVRTFHLQSALDYIASGAYLTEPDFQRFVQARGDAIRERGGRVDLMR